MYTENVHFFTNFDLFCIDNARVIYRKIRYFTYNLIKLVTFKVLPSTLDTPLPTFFPVLEGVLERVLWDGAKVQHRIFFYLIYRLKPFSEDFNFGNKKKSAGTKSAE